MNNRPYTLGIVLFLGTLIISGCGTATVEPTTGLANPASVYCEEQGYVLEMRTNADGGTYGVCIFLDGSECEEWAFYRGECRPALTSEATVDTPEPVPTAEPLAEEEPTKAPEPVPTEVVTEKPDVVYEGISFTFDHAIAADVVAESVPATDEQGPGWTVEPAHIRFSLNGYVLPETFHEPRILIYPVSEWAPSSR